MICIHVGVKDQQGRRYQADWVLQLANIGHEAFLHLICISFAFAKGAAVQKPLGRFRSDYNAFN